MSDHSSEGPRISDTQLAEVLALAKDSDSVELKLTVPDADRRATVNALGIDPLEAQIRQVFFFDTPDLVLNQHGVVVRARRIQGRGDDSVVKLRPVVPHELPDEWRTSSSLVVEVDAMPGGYVCSASMRGTPGSHAVKSVAASGQGIHKLFSKEQRAFFKAYAPDGISLDDLSILGPITLLKVKFAPEDYNRRLVGEFWFYPDGSRILELSTKCAPGEGFQTAAELRAFLGNKGVNLSGEQQTKTKAALEYFSANLETGATP